MLQTVLKALKQAIAPSGEPIEQGDPLIYALESPTYPLARLGADNVFSGWVFYYGGKIVEELSVYQDHVPVGRYPVNGVRDDVAQHAARVPAARTSGFGFPLRLDPAAAVYRFECLFDDGSREALFQYDIREIVQWQDRFAVMQARLQGLPVPGPELVFLTQGHREVDIYRDSIIPGFMTMKRYLEHSGVEFPQLGTILDFGCGSGRLLLGWHLYDARIQLSGCDINEQLVSWAQQSLPEPIQIRRTGLHPPLSFHERQFDLVYLISVFTHLSLDNQRNWVKEFQRLLKPGGYILLSLHGEIYVRHVYGEQSTQYQEFCRSGYIESPEQVEGKNEYGTFHAKDFLRRLFGAGFRLQGYFPNGSIAGQRTLFRIALAQDVYVLRYLP